MARRKTRDLISHLNADEQAGVLAELLKSHPELIEEANVIAQFLVDDICADDIAFDVADRVGNIGIHELNDRTDSHPFGYVEPCEAAWELLEEEIEDVRAEMFRKGEGGMESAAGAICQGIILGLYQVRDEGSDGALGWAEDFPKEAAASAVADLLKKYPIKERQAAGERIIEAIADDAPDWVEMLERVVEAASRRGRKRR